MMDKEVFLCALLNTRNVITRVFVVSVGSLNASIVHPREVFGPATRHSAASIIMVHNHPAGDPEASSQDYAATKRIYEAGELLGIPLIDSIIIGDGQYHSMRAAGEL